MIGEAQCWNPTQPRIYPPRFGAATAQLMPKLKSAGEGAPQLTSLADGLPDGPAIFNSMSWNTEISWDEVRFKPLLVYLRGNKGLNLPARWKATMPTRL